MFSKIEISAVKIKRKIRNENNNRIIFTKLEETEQYDSQSKNLKSTLHKSLTISLVRIEETGAKWNTRPATFLLIYEIKL